MNRPFRKPTSPAPRPSSWGVFFGPEKGGKPQRIAKRLPPILSPRIWAVWLPGHFRRLPVDVQFSTRHAPGPDLPGQFPGPPRPSPALPGPFLKSVSRPVRGPPGPSSRFPLPSPRNAPRTRSTACFRPFPALPLPGPSVALPALPRSQHFPQASGVGKFHHQGWGSPVIRCGEVRATGVGKFQKRREGNFGR
jgi:hypothetical protein